jgi:hypothetical protein
MFNVDNADAVNIKDYPLLSTLAEIIEENCGAKMTAYFSDGGCRFSVFVSKGKGNYGVEVLSESPREITADEEAVVLGQLSYWWFGRPKIKGMYDFLFD